MVEYIYYYNNKRIKKIKLE
ncbi:TPA: hypothetical protein KRI65_000536 [Clostridioides difficile]|nr:hypothetical protein C4E42_02405 [Clostridioides difficile]AVD41282.1 hypothetical protein C4E26_03030 [Clostridioides difficile]AVD44784.1 hypothetical protein C4E25_03035 [Clostridioides difficile]EGT2240198.1 hypothetical protein [Clostridioides difficile]EGT3685629.1 hypothetical protein [Clostridioides difficile]